MRKTGHDLHHSGLTNDIVAMKKALNRRQILRYAAGGLVAIPAGSWILGCGDSLVANPDAAGGGDASDAVSGTCQKIPRETGGPFPGDGSNGPNVLNATGVVRRNITTSFAGLTGTAVGVSLTVKLKIRSSQSSCAGLAGHAVYVWHCDRAGLYSLYSPGATEQNYLRGVQQTDENGELTFETIFPGCYPGRWPHIHFDVFSSLAAAGAGSPKIVTSQLAFTRASCEDVYATAGYESSVGALSPLRLETDSVFRDGALQQIATMTGSVAAGITASLDIVV
jgi:protocatechuate 3,4-dioxygenase beta subunit